MSQWPALLGVVLWVGCLVFGSRPSSRRALWSMHIPYGFWITGCIATAVGWVLRLGLYGSPSGGDPGFGLVFAGLVSDVGWIALWIRLFRVSLLYEINEAKISYEEQKDYEAAMKQLKAQETSEFLKGGPREGKLRVKTGGFFASWYSGWVAIYGGDLVVWKSKDAAERGKKPLDTWPLVECTEVGMDGGSSNRWMIALNAHTRSGRPSTVTTKFQATDEFEAALWVGAVRKATTLAQTKAGLGVGKSKTLPAKVSATRRLTRMLTGDPGNVPVLSLRSRLMTAWLVRPFGVILVLVGGLRIAAGTVMMPSMGILVHDGLLGLIMLYLTALMRSYRSSSPGWRAMLETGAATGALFAGAFADFTWVSSSASGNDSLPVALVGLSLFAGAIGSGLLPLWFARSHELKTEKIAQGLAQARATLRRSWASDLRKTKKPAPDSKRDSKKKDKKKNKKVHLDVEEPLLEEAEQAQWDYAADALTDEEMEGHFEGMMEEDALQRYYFQQFLLAEFEVEVLFFVMDAREYSGSESDERANLAETIVEKYIDANSPLHLTDLTNYLKEEIVENYEAGDFRRGLFSDAMAVIQARMVEELYPRFRKSSYFKDYVDAWYSQFDDEAV